MYPMMIATAARTLYRSGQALGVGCAEYPSPSAAQAPTPRPAEYARSNPTTQRSVARADEPARVSTSRSSAPRVAEYSTRATTSRQVARAERAPDPAAATASHPAAVIFPPSGGMEIRSLEAPAPAVVASRPAPEPRRQAAPATVQRPPDAAAIALAKAATEASAAAEREVAAEAAKREEAVTADKAERRTQLTIFGGIALVVTTGVAYSVYRAARTSPLRGLALCLIELGVI